MSESTFSLSQLGWRAFYSQQLSLHDLDHSWPARVASVHRNAVSVLGESGECSVTLPGSFTGGTSVELIERLALTVGDWVLVEYEAPRIARVLERISLIARVGAGTNVRVQDIAANLDTVFVVTSCNDDFNSSRLERYLAVALDARIDPVIVLTKSDLCNDVSGYLSQALRLAPRVPAICVDARSEQGVLPLMPWLGGGQTVACIGSSGVGKSTLANTLSGTSKSVTSGVRENDSKGRHTTTSRQLMPLPGGAWLIDTPGMRELKVGAVEAGVRAVFIDIDTIARSCRFRDCTHQADAGCALLSAVAEGTLDERRFRSYMKLQREAANASRTLHERRERERQFSRMQKVQMAQHRKTKPKG